MLEPDPASRFRKAGYQVIDRICKYYYSLEEQPIASRVEPGYIGRSVPGKTTLFTLQAKDLQAIAEPRHQKNAKPSRLSLMT